MAELLHAEQLFIFRYRLCGVHKIIAKYRIQYFFREFPILYREKSIRSTTYQYFFFIRVIAIIDEERIFFVNFIKKKRSSQDLCKFFRGQWGVLKHT